MWRYVWTLWRKNIATCGAQRRLGKRTLYLQWSVVGHKQPWHLHRDIDEQDIVEHVLGHALITEQFLGPCSQCLSRMWGPHWRDAQVINWSWWVENLWNLLEVTLSYEETAIASFGFVPLRSASFGLIPPRLYPLITESLHTLRFSDSDS
jgi:hypothetical protein